MKIGTDIFDRIRDFAKTALNEYQKIIAASSLIEEAKRGALRWTGMSDTDIDKLVSAVFVGESVKRGIDPDTAYNDLPKELKDVFIYTPQELRAQQELTLTGIGLSIGAFLAGGAAALLGAPIGVTGVLISIAFLLQGVVNHINDTFHWGPLMANQNLLDVQKSADDAKIAGITEYGSLKESDIIKLAEDYSKATIPGFRNPKTNELYPSTAEGVRKALEALIGMLNVAGESPTPSEAIVMLSGWALPPTSQAGHEIVEQLKAKPAEAKVTVPVTRITVKPKLFLGTIVAGRVGPVTLFTRTRDDRITDDADLLLGAEANLARWLSSLPGKLTFTIDIKMNPLDENNVKLPGAWAVMTLYVTSKFGKSLLIDEVILGPLDPQTYYPETSRLVEVAGSLPDFAKFAKIEPGEIYGPLTAPSMYIPVPGLAAELPAAAEKKEQVPAAPTVYTYYYPDDKTGLPVEVKATSQEEARKQAAALGLATTEVLPSWKKTYAVPAIELTPVQKKTLELGGVIFPSPRTVTVNVDTLYVRSCANRACPLAGTQILYRGNTFQVVGYVYGEKVDGIEERWWVSQYGNNVWVGGTTEKP